MINLSFLKSIISNIEFLKCHKCGTIITKSKQIEGYMLLYYQNYFEHIRDNFSSLQFCQTPNCYGAIYPQFKQEYLEKIHKEFADLIHDPSLFSLFQSSQDLDLADQQRLKQFYNKFIRISHILNLFAMK